MRKRLRAAAIFAAASLAARGAGAAADGRAAQAARQLAMSYTRLGLCDKAVAAWAAAFKLQPGGYMDYVALAECDIRLGRLREGKEAFDHAKRFKGHERAAYIREGYAFLDAGDDARSEEDFRSAIAQDPLDPSGYHHLGNFLRTHGRLPEAESSLRRALELMERDPRVDRADVLRTAAHLVEVLIRRGEPDQADQAARAGLALAAGRPDAEPAHSRMRKAVVVRLRADIELMRSHAARAGRLYREAAGLCAEPGACWPGWRANLLSSVAAFDLKQGRRLEALAEADRAWAIDPSSPDVLPAELGDVFAALGEDAKAEKAYRRVIELHDDMPAREDISDLAAARRGLARLMEARGRRPEAEELLAEAARSCDRYGDWKPEADILESLAKDYDRDGRPGPAAQARDRARVLRENPR